MNKEKLIKYLKNKHEIIFNEFLERSSKHLNENFNYDYKMGQYMSFEVILDKLNKGDFD